jgi:hypothetical protein
VERLVGVDFPRREVAVAVRSVTIERDALGSGTRRREVALAHPEPVCRRLEVVRLEAVVDGDEADRPTSGRLHELTTRLTERVRGEVCVAGRHVAG